MSGLFAQIVSASAEKTPTKEAVCDASGSLTYAALFDEAGSLARAFIAHGLAAGDRVALILPNGLDFVRAHFAVLAAGAISVPCEANVATAALEAVLRTSRPRFAVVSPQAWARVADTIRAAGVTPIVAAQGVSEDEPQPFDLHGWLQEHRCSTQPLPVVDAGRAATLMFTTGSTGAPKGVVLTHRNVLAAIDNIVRFVRYTSDDREVVTLPLSHNFGLGHVYCNLRSGGSVYLENGLLRVGRVLDALARFRATGFPGTPLGFGLLLDRFAPVLADKGRELRFVVINSAALPAARARQLQALLPNTELFVYYGLTEASRSTFLSLTAAGERLYESVGRAMPGVELRTVASDGAPTAAGEEGEIEIRGETVTPGYWELPEATAQALRGGWLRTGDLGQLDTEGHLFLTGRTKEVVNVGGYKVNPSEVDRAFVDNALRADVAVAGVRGAFGRNDESLVAAVVVPPGTAWDTAAERMLAELGHARLEAYKVPVAFVPLAVIPRTESGKIKRAELTAQLQAALHVDPHAPSRD